jgi:AAA family ATP:ADP antiporter
MARTIRGWFRSITNVRSGEVAPVSLMFAYGFLAMTSYYILKPIRNSVFIDRVGADNLPYIYILTAIVVTVVMVVYSRYVDRVREIALLLGTFAFLGACILLFRLWLREGDSIWSSGTFYIWGKLYPLLIVSQFYLVGNLLFTTRQAKRLFGIIGVGLILGGIAGSSIAALAAEVVGTENLMLVAAGILVVCAALVILLKPHMSGGERSASGRLLDDVSGDALRLLRTSSHLRTIAFILGFTIVVGTLIDWQFNSAVEQFIQGEDAKTQFFGKFFAALNVASVLIQIFLTGFVLRKFGIGVAMLALPLGLVVASLGVVALPILLMAVLAKGTEGALRYSLDQSTRELLYLPVPTEIKYKAKPLIDLAVYRGGTGAGGLILIVMVNVLGLGIREVAIAVVLLIGLWIAATLRMRGEFKDSIKRLIGVRDVELDELILQRLDAETIHELESALEGGKEDEVLYALALLQLHRRPETAQRILPLLHHTSSSVRAQAVFLLHELGSQHVMGEVEGLLEDPSLDVRVEAIHYVCDFSEVGPLDQMGEFLRSADGRVRVAAIACMVRHGDAEARRMVEELVAELAHDADAEVRESAADVLGSWEPLPPQGEGLLTELVDDRSIAVRRMVLRAIGTTRTRSLLPVLVDRLGTAKERRAASGALRDFGPTAHGTLIDYVRDPRTPKAVRLAIPRLLYDAADKGTIDLLVGVLPGCDPATRFEVLRLLNKLRRNRKELDFSVYPAEELATREAREGYRWLMFQAAYERHEDRTEARGLEQLRREGDLLARTLLQRRHEAAERALRSLGLRYDLEDLYAAYTALVSDDSLSRQRGYELLENCLPRRVRQFLDPLLNPDRSIAQASRAAAAELQVEPPAPEDVLTALAEGDDFWTAVLARQRLGGEGLMAAVGAGETNGRHGIMEIVERAEVLRRTDLFSNLRIEDLASLAALVEEREYSDQEVLFDEGAVGHELFIIVEGRVEAVKAERTLFTADPGQTVGDLSLLDGLPTNYRAVAVKPTRTLILGCEDFYNLLDERSRVQRAVLTHMAGVVRRLNERVEGRG